MFRHRFLHLRTFDCWSLPSCTTFWYFDIIWCACILRCQILSRHRYACGMTRENTLSAKCDNAFCKYIHIATQIIISHVS
jgi:hypothetical protein